MAKRKKSNNPMAVPVPSKDEADYRAEDDHRTLMRAEEIRQDPSRVKGVARHHAKMSQDIARVGEALTGASEERPAPRRAMRGRLAGRRVQRGRR